MKCDFAFGYLLRFKGQELDRWNCASVDCINIHNFLNLSIYI